MRPQFLRRICWSVRKRISRNERQKDEGELGILRKKCPGGKKKEVLKQSQLGERAMFKHNLEGSSKSSHRLSERTLRGRARKEKTSAAPC